MQNSAENGIRIRKTKLCVAEGKGTTGRNLLKHYVFFFCVAQGKGTAGRNLLKLCPLVLRREKERRAERIAAEIEGSEKSRAHVELENGDEEEAFSAVQRPADRRSAGGGRDRELPADDKTSTYIPPGLGYLLLRHLFHQ
jgi:hypothetical protein